MVIRMDTTCPLCGKEKSVYGFDRSCHNCKLKSWWRGQIKRSRVEKQLTKELREMKPEIKKKLHEEILKELLEEEKRIPIKKYRES